MSLISKRFAAFSEKHAWLHNRIKAMHEQNIFELFFCIKYLLVGASSMFWTSQWISESVSK